MSDEPIEPQNYLGGVTVVDIGDIRVARGMTRRPVSVCTHRAMVYDPKERRVWCKDCEKDVDAFDAFTALVGQYHSAHRDLEDRLKRTRDAEKAGLHLLAAKVIEKEWRSRTRVPMCPHCNNGLFPEHFANGCSSLGRDYALARLKKQVKP